MEQQLTIMCSDDLNETVARTLNRILEEGYLHLPHAFGVKPKEHVIVDTSLSFPASVFIVTSPEAQIKRIVAELKEFSNQCRVRPCLKMIVSEVTQIY